MQVDTQMSTDTEVLIIGGGVIGVCCAHYLAEAGCRVALMEKGEICSGCSEANAGLIAASQSIPLAAPGVIRKALKWMLDPASPFYLKPRLDLGLFRWLWRFRAACTEERMRRGLALLRDLGRASQQLLGELAAIQDIGFTVHRNGLLKPFVTEEGFEEGVAEAELLKEFGIEANTLGADEARAMLPDAPPSLVGATHFPGDGHLDPAEFVGKLAQHAEARGAVIHTNAEVVGFESEGRRIVKVRTQGGEFRADHVVLAAGAWSAPLARKLGLRLPVQPAKGYAVTLPAEAPSDAVPLLLGEAKVAVTPLGDRVRFSGTLEFAGMDLSLNERRLDAIRRAGRQFRPVPGDERGETWAGLRPCTPDGLPLVGRTRAFENLLVATGHATKGICLGPITGKIIAQLICDEKPVLDPAGLNPDRFG